MPENTDPWVSCSNFTVSILNPRVCKFKFSVGQESMGTDQSCAELFLDKL